MHNSIFSAILSFKTFKADLFFEKVNHLLPEVFEPLHKVQDLGDPDIRKSVVYYIALVYSLDSPLIVAGRDDIKNKNVAAKEAGLPDYLTGPVILLKSHEVREAVLKYLEEQPDRDWRHLNIKKMQYEYLMEKSVLDTVNEDGKVDHKFILQCSASADTLFNSIQELEKRLNDKYKNTYDAIDEVQRLEKSYERRASDGGLNIESAVLNQK